MSGVSQPRWFSLFHNHNIVWELSVKSHLIFNMARTTGVLPMDSCFWTFYMLCFWSKGSTMAYNMEMPTRCLQSIEKRASCKAEDWLRCNHEDLSFPADALQCRECMMVKPGQNCLPLLTCEADPAKELCYTQIVYESEKPSSLLLWIELLWVGK